MDHKYIDIVTQNFRDAILSLRNATSNSRSTSAYLGLASIVIFLSIYNLYHSWNLKFNYKDRPEFIFDKNLSLYSGTIKEDLLKERVKLGLTNENLFNIIVDYETSNKICEEYDAMVRKKLTKEYEKTQYTNKEIDDIRLFLNQIIRKYELGQRIDNPELKDIIKHSRNERGEKILASELNNQNKFFIDTKTGLLTLKIPLIGIEAPVSDLVFLGNLGILVLLIWHYYNVLSEHTILKDLTKKLNWLVRQSDCGQYRLLLYTWFREQIIDSFVFTSLSDVYIYRKQRKMADIYQMLFRKVNSRKNIGNFEFKNNGMISSYIQQFGTTDYGVELYFEDSNTFISRLSVFFGTVFSKLRVSSIFLNIIPLFACTYNISMEFYSNIISDLYPFHLKELSWKFQIGFSLYIIIVMIYLMIRNIQRRNINMQDLLYKIKNSIKGGSNNFIENQETYVLNYVQKGKAKRIGIFKLIISFLSYLYMALLLFIYLFSSFVCYEVGNYGAFILTFVAPLFVILISIKRIGRYWRFARMFRLVRMKVSSLSNFKI